MPKGDGLIIRESVLCVTNSRLSAQLLIHSSDSFLGLPYNIASLALLATMLAQQREVQSGEIIVCTTSAVDGDGLDSCRRLTTTPLI